MELTFFFYIFYTLFLYTYYYKGTMELTFEKRLICLDRMCSLDRMCFLKAMEQTLGKGYFVCDLQAVSVQ